MSERERWIVYPLLFLALGSALRDKLLKQTTAERIICEKMFCESLSLIDEEGRRLALLENGTLQLDTVRANRVDANNYLRRGQPQNASADGTTTIPVPQLLNFMRAAGILPANQAAGTVVPPQNTAENLINPVPPTPTSGDEPPGE